jgi:hypothetical protein
MWTVKHDLPCMLSFNVTCIENVYVPRMYDINLVYIVTSDSVKNYIDVSSDIEHCCY